MSVYPSSTIHSIFHFRRLSHSFTYLPTKYDRNIALDKCTGTPKGYFSISQDSNTQSEMWGVVNQMKLMSESDRIRRHKGQKTIGKNRRSKHIEHQPNEEHVLYMFLEMQGFGYEDVMTGIEFLCDHYSLQELRWHVLCMQVDRKQVRIHNMQSLTQSVQISSPAKMVPFIHLIME